MDHLGVYEQSISKVKKMAKNRARISILSEVLSFPTLGTKWTSCFAVEMLQVGDLVAMNCAPATKYYLSWLHEINPNNGWPKYLLESIEDGELCWWENIGLSYYNRKRIANCPSWKWDDNQFSFNDRWKRVCYKKNDAYIILPCEPLFTDDGGVFLDVRVRFSLSDYHDPIYFSNWKKVTLKMMDEYFKKSSKKYEELRT